MSDARPGSVPRTSAPGPRATLRHLDTALADDVDHLLDGSFETVHSILADLAEAAEPEAEQPEAVEPAPPPDFDDESVAVPAPVHPAAPEAPPASRPDPARLFSGHEEPIEDDAPPSGAMAGDAPAEASHEAWAAHADASWGTGGVDEVLPTAASEPPPLLAVKVLLAVLSLPLRAVPVSMRPALDWFALSLLFWVPIVWIVVWLMVQGD